MDRAYIIEEDKKTIFEVSDNSYRAAVFYDDGRIEPLGDHIFDLFSVFALSNNNKELPNEGIYRVVLDNDTGFKHYFVGDSEDYVMFYRNNGEDATLYYETLQDNGWRPEEHLTFKEKVFKVGKKIVQTSFTAFLSIALLLSIHPYALEELLFLLLL